MKAQLLKGWSITQAYQIDQKKEKKARLLCREYGSQSYPQFIQTTSPINYQIIFHKQFEEVHEFGFGVYASRVVGYFPLFTSPVHLLIHPTSYKRTNLRLELILSHRFRPISLKSTSLVVDNQLLIGEVFSHRLLMGVEVQLRKSFAFTLAPFVQTDFNSDLMYYGIQPEEFKVYVGSQVGLIWNL